MLRYDKNSLIARKGRRISMAESKKVVVFQVRNEDYAVPIDYVISIEKISNITPIPHLPRYVNGIISMRERLVPIVDFEQILYESETIIHEETRIIVIQTDAMTIGAIVKDAKEIIDVPAHALNQVGLIGYEKTKYFTGIANLNNRLISIIDPTILVNMLEGIKDIQAYLNEMKQSC